MQDIDFSPLPKAEVIKAIERRRPRRIPCIRTHWYREGLNEVYGEGLKALDRYPEDAMLLTVSPLDPEKMNLSWYSGADERAALDAGGALPEWKHLDEFIEKMPDATAPGLLDAARPHAERAHREDLYMMLTFWRFFFERPWGFRGMQNFLTDFYLNPGEVHRLQDALCTLYEGIIRRAADELKPDGFFTSDDLGNQRQLMMRPEHFREFIKPYYRRIAKLCRELGLHFWLHSCGNNTEIMQDLIEVGVDVFHPVQKHTMDERAIARRFGDRLAFHAGFDVQQTIVTASPEEVRAEVRFLIDTFDRDDGGMCLAAGNGILPGTPIENIEVFLDEALRYGTTHRARANA